MKKCLASLAAVLISTAAGAAAHAADDDVAPGGSASKAGTTAAPWTFATALGSTGAGPGDTVCGTSIGATF